MGTNPAVLRPKFTNRLLSSVGHPLNAEDQVFAELEMLRSFIYNCDAAGTPIPNDSVKFRENFFGR